MTPITLEICVDDAAGIRAAATGGANRIELCAALALGGLTPSAGLMELAAAGPLPAMAMIRPRAGDFVWTGDELAAMRAEIAAARRARLTGVVIGASHPDGRLHAEMLADLIAAAAGMDVTLHRAIDLTPDPAEAMRLVDQLGIRRVLSSGGAATAAAGIERLALMAGAAPKVIIMPGGGVSDTNAALFAARLPLCDIHASASVPAGAPALAQVGEFGFQPPGARQTSVERVRALRRALDAISAAAGD